MPNELKVSVSYRQIWAIALPIALALVVPQLNLVINSIFLAHHSEQSLALASITGVYYLVFAAIGFGLNNGLQTLISRRAGEDRPEEIGRIFTQGVCIALIIALGGIIITYTLTPFIFHSFLPRAQADESLVFLRIRILGLPFLFVYQLRNALLVGINQSKYLIIGTLAETITNVVLDYALIFGHFGLPAMGFNGAAIASIIAEFTGMVVIFSVISRKGITQQFSLFKSLRIDRERAGSILRMSGPLMFQHAASILAWLFFYVLIARNVSQTGLAVSTIIRTVFALFGTFFWSLAATTNSMVSNIIGQGRRDEVLHLVKKIAGLSLIIGVLICILLNLFPGQYLALFRPDDLFIQTGIPVLRAIGGAMVLLSTGVIWLNAVTGTGNSRITFLIEIVTLVFYCTYVFVVMEVKKGSVLLGWCSEFLYWLLLFCCSYIYMRSNKWKSKII